MANSIDITHTNTSSHVEEALRYGISDATVRNWKKLHTKASGRLTARANKRKSKKRVLPLEYFSNKDNIDFIQDLLDFIDNNQFHISMVIYSLASILLEKAGLLHCAHVKAIMQEYAHIGIIPELSTLEIPDDEFDLLGLIYQSYLFEGEKNTIGSYYTPPKIIQNMVGEISLSKGQTFLDPCCGSGAFLISIQSDNPDSLWGIDNDETAVFIAKVNLLLKYRDFVFTPNVFCFDYLAEKPGQDSEIINKQFDFIATNPPWGAKVDDYHFDGCVFKESFSCFFIKSFHRLTPNGKIRFLFPESILNVKVHKDIREFMLTRAGIIGITIYPDTFSCVTTKFIDIECGYGANEEHCVCHVDNTEIQIDIQSFYETENRVFNLLSSMDSSIIKRAKSKGRCTLAESVWALGVVTGDNKGKLFSECQEGMEKIYTGKEIQPFILRPAVKYIRYDRSQLQQAAKEEIYRAPEKLVYKFISNKLTFAYDNERSLFLNSANILIPVVPSMSIKTVMAFLNSELFQFLYLKLFGEVKILKGNLMELPFPKLTSAQDNELTIMVEKVLEGESNMIDTIQAYIYNYYDISDDERKYIRGVVYGKAD